MCTTGRCVRSCGMYVIAWSALSFFMGVAVYFELQKYDDPLYHHQQLLLSQFPLDGTHSSTASIGCNAVSHGSTHCIVNDLFLPVTSLKFFFRIFFSEYDSNGESAPTLSCSTTCNVQNTKPHSARTEDNNKTAISKASLSQTDQLAGGGKVASVSWNQTYESNEKIHAPFNYPIAIVGQGSRFHMNWELLFILGGIISATFGVAVVVYVGVHCCGLICRAIKHKHPPDQSVDQVLIPAEALQLFKENFELVVHNRNIHFRRAEEYFRAGAKVNMEKNALLAENRALKREVTCLQARLTNQRYYIEMLERLNVSCTENKMVNTARCMGGSSKIGAHDCNRADRRIFADSDVGAQALEDARNQYLSSDDSQWTFLEVEEQSDIIKESGTASQCYSTSADSSNSDNRISRVSTFQKTIHRCLETSKGRECLVGSPQDRAPEQTVAENVGQQERPIQVFFPMRELRIHFPNRPKMHRQSLSGISDHTQVLTRKRGLVSSSRSDINATTSTQTVVLERFSADDMNIHTSQTYQA